MNEWMNEWMSEWKDKWMDEWINEWVIGWRIESEKVKRRPRVAILHIFAVFSRVHATLYVAMLVRPSHCWVLVIFSDFCKFSKVFKVFKS